MYTTIKNFLVNIFATSVVIFIVNKKLLNSFNLIKFYKSTIVWQYILI